MNYIIFDLEATCGNEVPREESEIIEIGAVKLNEKLEVVDEFQTFIRPEKHPVLTPFCQELTTIAQSDVDKAPSFEIALPEFVRWCKQISPTNPQEDAYFLCSWGFYDKKMLKSSCERAKFKTDWLKHHMSIKHQHGEMIARDLEKTYYDKFPRNKAADMLQQLKKGVGMNTALDMLGLPLEGTHHRGIDDAKNIAKIFVKLFPRLSFK